MKRRMSSSSLDPETCERCAPSPITGTAFAIASSGAKSLCRVRPRRQPSPLPPFIQVIAPGAKKFRRFKLRSFLDSGIRPWKSCQAQVATKSSIRLIPLTRFLLAHCRLIREKVHTGCRAIHWDRPRMRRTHLLKRPHLHSTAFSRASERFSSAITIAETKGYREIRTPLPLPPRVDQ